MPHFLVRVEENESGSFIYTERAVIVRARSKKKAMDLVAEKFPTALKLTYKRLSVSPKGDQLIFIGSAEMFSKVR